MIKKIQPTGNPLFAIGKNEEFTLLSYEYNYYFVDYNKKRGYVYYASLFGLPGTEEFKNFWDTKLLGGDSQPNQEPTKDELWIGMADSAVSSVLGVPEKINCADDAFGEQEQWAYKDKLLFFENGVLTEWKSFE